MPDPKILRDPRCTDWTHAPLGYWLTLAGKPMTTESLWKKLWKEMR